MATFCVDPAVPHEIPDAENHENRWYVPSVEVLNTPDPDVDGDGDED